MADCDNCGGVLIQAGAGLDVIGSGSDADPYVIGLSDPIPMRGEDTDSIRMTITGQGTDADPYVVSATAAVKVSELEDIQGAEIPVAGDVILHNGTNWTIGPPPTQAPGQVNTGAGISGDGTVGDPIALEVSDLVSDSTSGLATYIDTAGQLRAEVRAQVVTWASVQNKPTTFTPSAHSHPMSQLSGIHVGTTDPASGLGSVGDLYFKYAAA